MADIKLNNTIDNTLSNIDKDINDISDILINVYNAVMTLDETKWNTKEKIKIDEDFVPYLEKISTMYPDYLRKRLLFTKNAVQKYRELNKELEKETENLEDLS